MAKRILKYEIRLDGYQIISVPKHSFPLTVQIQQTRIMMWMVCTDEESTLMRVWVVGTGDTIPVAVPHVARYAGAIQLDAFVWHIFAEVT